MGDAVRSHTTGCGRGHEGEMGGLAERWGREAAAVRRGGTSGCASCPAARAQSSLRQPLARLAEPRYQRCDARGGGAEGCMAIRPRWSRPLTRAAAGPSTRCGRGLDGGVRGGGRSGQVGTARSPGAEQANAWGHVTAQLGARQRGSAAGQKASAALGGRGAARQRGQRGADLRLGAVT